MSEEKLGEQETVQPDPELLAAMESVQEQQDGEVSLADAIAEEEAETEASGDSGPDDSAPTPASEELAPEAEDTESKPKESRVELSERMAKLAKEEWELTQERKRLKEEGKKLEEAAAQGNMTAAEYEQLRSAAKDNPFGVLQHLGIDPRTIVDSIVENGGIPEARFEAPKAEAAKPESDEVSTLKQELQELRALVQGKQEEEILAEFERSTRAEAAELLKSEAYDGLNAIPRSDPVDLIYNNRKAHAEQTGEVLTVEQVADRLKTAWNEDLAAMKSNEKFMALVRTLLADDGQETPQPKPQSKSGKALTSSGGRSSKPPKGELADRDIADADIFELSRDLPDSLWGA